MSHPSNAALRTKLTGDKTMHHILYSLSPIILCDYCLLHTFFFLLFPPAIKMSILPPMVTRNQCPSRSKHIHYMVDQCHPKVKVCLCIMVPDLWYYLYSTSCPQKLVVYVHKMIDNSNDSDDSDDSHAHVLNCRVHKASSA